MPDEALTEPRELVHQQRHGRGRKAVEVPSAEFNRQRRNAEDAGVTLPQDVLGGKRRERPPTGGLPPGGVEPLEQGGAQHRVADVEDRDALVLVVGGDERPGVALAELGHGRLEAKRRAVGCRARVAGEGRAGRQVVATRVVALPKPRGGEDVAAAIVVRDGVDISSETVRDYCKTRLAAYKVPRRIVVVDDLPRSLIGKVLRREVRERLMSS